MQARIAQMYPQLLRIARANMRTQKNSAGCAENAQLAQAQNAQKRITQNTDVNDINIMLEKLRQDESIGTQTEQEQGQAEAQQVSEKLGELLERLQQNCNGLKITVGSFDSTSELQQYAKQAGAGMNLIIDERYLEWMTSSQDNFARGSEKIISVVDTLKQRTVAAANQPGKTLVNSGAAIDDVGNSSYWVATGESSEQIKPPQTDSIGSIDNEYQKIAQMKMDALKKMLSTKQVFPVNPGRQAAKLASIDTVESVRSVAGSVSAGIVMLRSSGSKYDEAQVKPTLRQLEKILGMAYSKIKHLENEAAVKSRQKKAELQRQQRRAEQRRAELRRMQTDRRAREYGLARTCTPMAPLLDKRDEDERRREEQAELAQIAAEISAAMPAVDCAGAPATIECTAPGMEGVIFTDVAVTEVCVSGTIDTAA